MTPLHPADRTSDHTSGGSAGHNWRVDSRKDPEGELAPGLNKEAQESQADFTAHPLG